MPTKKCCTICNAECLLRIHCTFPLFRPQASVLCRTRSVDLIECAQQLFGTFFLLQATYSISGLPEHFGQQESHLRE